MGLPQLRKNQRRPYDECVERVAAFFDKAAVAGKNHSFVKTGYK